jgi:tetratricopeptide (TPR) repeat protein
MQPGKCRNRPALGQRRDLGPIVVGLVCCALTCISARAQTAPDNAAAKDAMGEHYASAQKALTAKDIAAAETEYTKFISDALRRLAGRRAVAGELPKSAALLEEALELEPNNVDLRLDYAGACRASGDLSKAKTAAESALSLEPQNLRALLEMGRVLSQMGEDKVATSYLERAVALEPNFENGFALAKEYLKRKEPDGASKIFAEMQAGLGDSPQLHMEFGSAYGEANYAERAIPEFQKALAKNEKIRGGHYSLGAAYLLGLGNVMQDQAEAEFRKELQNYPDDPLSLYQLGNIEFNRHEMEIAERDLTKAKNLDESNPDTYLLLAQIYNESGRATEAEAALRKSIALTSDVTRNNYQVQRAHYLLGRLLMQSGHQDEAKLEIKIADRLLKESTAATQGLAATPATAPFEATRTRPVAPIPAPLHPENIAEADAFERKIKNAVADSYNNLAAMAASANNFPAALRDFRHAAQWNPSLEGLDANWGRAAFSAGDYQQAVAPLSRHLENDPYDSWTRAALGSSYFSLQKYLEAVETLRPIEDDLGGDRPQLSYIYAVSQVKSGELDAGVKRLETLEKSNPNVALIPEALAEAYAAIGEMEKAAREREIAKTIRKRQNGTVSTPKPD